jgi:hypothetical protein
VDRVREGPHGGRGRQPVPGNQREVCSSFIYFRESPVAAPSTCVRSTPAFVRTTPVTLWHRVRSGIAVVASCFVLSFAANAWAAEAISIVLDEAKILRLPEKASTLIIGNPAVADGSLQAGGLLVVTGKGYGTTNLIALDPKGNVLAEYSLTVTAPRGMVTVYRGIDRESWSCDKQCERAAVLGDAPAYFKATVDQAKDRNAAATGAVTPAER